MIIYVARNKVNGKRYVGQTRQELKKRIRGHLLKASTPFGRALLKYGRDDFIIEPIAWCYSKEHLDFLEQLYIELYDCRVPKGYNISKGGRGGDTLTEEQKRRRSERMKGSGNPFYGRKHSKETRLHLSKVKMGIGKGKKCLWLSELNHNKTGLNNPMFGKTNTAEMRRKNSEANSGCRNANYGKRWSDEQRQLISRRVKEAMAKPEIRERFKKAVTDPQFRKKRSEKMKLISSVPECRKRRSEAAKRMWQKRREAA